MASHIKRKTRFIRYPDAMITGIRISIHSRGTDRGSSLKLINRHRPTRHLLRSRSLPLCPLHRSCLCRNSGMHPLIPPDVQHKHKPKNLKSTIYNNIPRGKYNLLPTTLPGTKRHAPSILRLPRCIYHVKYRFFPRIPYFLHFGAPIRMTNVRLPLIQTGMNFVLQYPLFNGMDESIPRRRTYI